MKKIALICCGCLVCIVGLVVYLSSDKKEKVEIMEYVLSSNEEHSFDETFSANSNTQFSVPDESPSKPITNYEKYSQFEKIDSIKPYYPLTVVMTNSSLDTWTYWQSDDKVKQNISMPIETPHNSKMDYLTVKSVYNYDLFHQGLKEGAVENRILHEFDSTSGVYISNYIYDQLNINEEDTKLFIELYMRVPVVAKETTSKMEGNVSFEYKVYQVTKYDYVLVILEVQGVIDGASGGFCLGNNIIIPYETAKSIINKVNKDAVVSDEGETYWKPNCYIITCDESVSVNELVEYFSTELSSFYLNEYVYGAEYSYPNSYLYTNGQLLLYGKY